MQASELEADEILAARKRASQAIRILKPYYNAGSVAKTQAEDGVDIEDKFKLDYLAPFLPQANIRTLSPSQATAARDACYQVRFCCIQYSMPLKLTSPTVACSEDQQAAFLEHWPRPLLGIKVTALAFQLSKNSAMLRKKHSPPS